MGQRYRHFRSSHPLVYLADDAGAPYARDTHAAQGVAGAEAEFQATKNDVMGPIAFCLASTPK